MYSELGALHDFDFLSGPAIYRALLLEELLEVDLGFAPASEFGPLGDGEFRVVSGGPMPRRPGTVDPGHLIGLAWHHVLHARICIQRTDPWQAEYWISAIRDHTLALACHRLGHPGGAREGSARAARRRHGARAERTRAQPGRRRAVARTAGSDQVLLQELRATDPDVANTLTRPLLDASRGPIQLTAGQAGNL